VKLSLSEAELVAYLTHLLEGAFPDGMKHDVARAVAAGLERAEHCFSRVALRGYRDERGATFDHLHGDQFAAFVYFASNSAWAVLEDERLALKLSLLNRARHALLIMPDTKLPDIFVIPHTVGTVIGKATYADHLVVCQNVTIANDLTTHLTFGAGVILFPGSFVVGSGTIGEASVIGANTTVRYEDVAANTVVTGSSPRAAKHARERDFLARFFIPPYPGFKEQSRD
jgi:serine O-acetyltransferase